MGKFAYKAIKLSVGHKLVTPMQSDLISNANAIINKNSNTCKHICRMSIYYIYNIYRVYTYLLLISTYVRYRLARHTYK